MSNLTADRLRFLLNYDQSTGVFRNIASRRKIRVGERAGYIDPSTGYVVIRIDRRPYYAHRLAFLYMKGQWPDQLVDHADGDRSNNAWKNLRDGSRRFNQQNLREATSASSSGLLGAYRKRSKWSSQIKVQDGLIRLGTFNTAEEAHAAYLAAKRKFHAGCTI